MKRRTGIYPLVLLFCLGTLTGCFESQREQEVASNPSVAKVSAPDLCKAYGTDKAKADKDYKGSIIEVYGPVQEIWDEGERTMVVLSGGKDAEVRCLVSSASEPDLADLKIGRPTMIKGKCRGVVRGDLTLGGCLIEDPLRNLKAKAKSGDASAEFDLANALSKTNEPIHDVRRAFGLLCKAAEARHGKAADTVMQALMGAWGPETNTPVIWKWLREEAEGGNTEACYLLGMLYNYDKDFGIDVTASIPWLKKASDGGRPEAMYTMAMFHYAGEFVPTNRMESARLLSLIDPKAVPRASEVLGLMNLTGDGVPKDVSKGLSLLKSAVAYGRAESATTLGRIYLGGDAVPKDEREALQWFRKAGDMGDPCGMAKAGLLLSDAKDETKQQQGRILILAALSNDMQDAYSEIIPHVMDSVGRNLELQNPPLATNDLMRFRRINGSLVQGILQSAGDKGLVLAVGTNLVAVSFPEIDVAGRTRCDPAFRQLLSRSLVLERLFGLVSQFKAPEPDKSATNDTAKVVLDLAEKGYSEAQALLGNFLLNDRKTERDGLDWLRKSADAGCPDGQYALGMAYLKGIGQPADITEAFRFFRLAADQGHTDSLLMTGRMLMAGEGCEKNEQAGLALAEKAANTAESRPVLFMGRYYYGNKLGMRDAAQAFAWFRLGAMMGTPEAQYWLGRMYYEGKGVPTDYNRAIQWLMTSASQGFRPAIELLDSDVASKQKMAEAKRAYQEDLARHSDRLDEIRKNPKYDLVLSSQKIPSFFRQSEKEAYLRFADNYFKGRFNHNIPLCVEEAYRYVNGGGGTAQGMSWGYIPPGSADWRDSMATMMGGGGTMGLSPGMARLTGLPTHSSYGAYTVDSISPNRSSPPQWQVREGPSHNGVRTLNENQFLARHNGRYGGSFSTARAARNQAETLNTQQQYNLEAIEAYQGSGSYQVNMSVGRWTYDYDPNSDSFVVYQQ